MSVDAATRRIIAFRLDDDGDWIAELECGHTIHMRHYPPWQTRPWVLTEEGRSRMLGATLACSQCARS